MFKYYSKKLEKRSQEAEEFFQNGCEQELQSMERENNDSNEQLSAVTAETPENVQAQEIEAATSEENVTYNSEPTELSSIPTKMDFESEWDNNRSKETEEKRRELVAKRLEDEKQKRLKQKVTKKTSKDFPIVNRVKRKLAALRQK